MASTIASLVEDTETIIISSLSKSVTDTSTSNTVSIEIDGKTESVSHGVLSLTVQDDAAESVDRINEGAVNVVEQVD